jgi:hypothetical protein
MKFATTLAGVCAAALALSACGGMGGSEFATRATAACVKEEGQASAAKCACQVAIVEKELNDKEKKAILLSMDQPADAGPEAGMKAMEAAGITMADMMSMGMKMMAVSAQAETQCSK